MFTGDVTTKYYIIQRKQSDFYIQKIRNGIVTWVSDRQYARRYQYKGAAKRMAARHWGDVVECELV